jgi:hypothetical protein
MTDTLAEAAVRPAVAETPVEAAEHAHACANCGARLQGPFCHACGQKGHLHGRLWHLVEEFAEGIAHFDGRLWRTLPLLAFNPGRLSREWRAGKRIRYVPPLHVFLFAVLLLFFTASVTGNHLVSPPAVNSGAAGDLAEQGVRVGVEGGPDADAPPWVLKMADYFEGKRDDAKYYAYKIETLLYKTSFLVIPLSVGILWLLLLFKRGFTLYDHSVVALYGLGFLALMVSVALAVSRWAGDLGAPIVLLALVHAGAHLKGAYALSWAGAATRAVFLGAFSAIAIGFFFAAVAAAGLNG